MKTNYLLPLLFTVPRHSLNTITIIKRAFLVFIVLISGGNLLAQDLVITANGDTLNCKITSEKGDFLLFNSMRGNEYRETMLAKSMIKEYKINYFDEAEVPIKKQAIEKCHQPFRLSLSGGVSYRLGKIPTDLPGEFKDYLKELKWGTHFTADASWFTSETLGFGLKYSRYVASNSLADVNVDVDGDGRIDHGKMSDDITISFVGPTVSTIHYSANKKNAFFGNLGLGYLTYRDQGEMAGFKANLEGSTFGTAGDLGYRIGMSKNLSLAVTLSYTLGVLSKVKQTMDGSTYTVKLKGDDKENLGRMDLSLGLVFHK